MRNHERVRELNEVAEELRRSGDRRLAEKVSQVMEDLRQETPAPDELMTTGEAAELLGVRSINTIKRWVRDGLLAGYRRGGRVLVTRSSMLKMKDGPTVAEQRTFERRLDAAVQPFEDTEEADLPTSATWEGRRPWEERANGPR